MSAIGRKSTYKRAFKDANHDGLRRPKRKPMVSAKYRESAQNFIGSNYE